MLSSIPLPFAQATNSIWNILLIHTQTSQSHIFWVSTSTFLEPGDSIAEQKLNGVYVHYAHKLVKGIENKDICTII